MKKKIMITGCSGYIGSHLCKMLEGQYEIHGIDLHDPIVPIDKFYKVDINRLFNIPDQTDPYHAVIHLAALVNVGESEKMPIMYYITNLNGTMNILNKIPTENFIFASTGAAALCESAYGISKRAAEDVIREFYARHRSGVNYTMFRFYNVIGSSYGIRPTNPDGLMLNLMKAEERGQFTIFGNDYNTPDGTCVRDYVHVLEICEALKSAIEEPANDLENLGHGVGTTVQAMVELYKKVNNVEFDIVYGPRRKGDAAVSVLDNPSRYMKHLFELNDLLKISE
jgi:UDP-glucose 4-epimerase